MPGVLFERMRTLLKPFAVSKGAMKIMRVFESCRYLDWRVWDKRGGNRRIYDALMSGRPLAIGKIGAVELEAIRNFLHYSSENNWEDKVRISRRNLFTNAGVYPDSPAIFQMFCEYFITDVLPEMTHMVVWFNRHESVAVKRYCREYTPVSISGLAAFRWDEPWTRALTGKRVLVVHPFSTTIRQQYTKREGLWGELEILPEFQLDTLTVPLQPILAASQHKDWFETLRLLQEEMSQRTFDIALVGAGAYSLPLVVHAKSLGRQGVHLGGGLQFYFGIRGRRWDSNLNYSKYYNDHWIRPLPEDTPSNNAIIENGCYW